MRLDLAVLLVDCFASAASRVQVIEQHAKDCLEYGVDIADANYMKEYQREQERTSGISSWFSLSSGNHLNPDPPPPPLECQSNPGPSLRRKIAKGVVKGVAKGVGKGVSTFFDEFRRR